MNFLESIGVLFLILIGIFFIIRYSSDKEEKERKRKKIIENSDKCQNLIYRYNKSIRDKKPIMTYHEFTKKLKEIADDPKVYKKAVARVEERQQREIEYQLERKENRKIGYKYDTEIFEIFSNKRELPRDLLIEKIGEKFHLEKKSAKELLYLWKENCLVNYCHWNSKNWEVGSVLTSNFYKIDDTDITRKDWLDQNNIILEPESEELKQYLNDNPLPF